MEKLVEFNREIRENREKLVKLEDMDLIYKKEAFQIIGACMEVYKDKGHGFVEQVYQECMEIELQHQGIDFRSQLTLPLSYRGRTLKSTYIPDLICFGKVIVELKAVKTSSTNIGLKFSTILKQAACNSAYSSTSAITLASNGSASSLRVSANNNYPMVLQPRNARNNANNN